MSDKHDNSAYICPSLTRSTMHYLRLLIFLLSTLRCAVNQAQNFEAFNYGESKGSNYKITHSAVVPGNGLVAAGYTNTMPDGGDHAFVIRYDDLGNVLWTKTYGPGEVHCITACPDGDFVLGGVIPDPYYRKDSFFVSRISSDGAIKWKKVLGIGSTRYWNRNCYIAIKPDGNYAVLAQLTTDGPISLTLLEASSGAVLDDHFINQGKFITPNGFLLAQNGDYIVYYWNSEEKGVVERLDPNFTTVWRHSLYLDYGYFSETSGLKIVERRNGKLVLGGGNGMAGVLFLNPDGTLNGAKGLDFGLGFYLPYSPEIFEDQQEDLHIIYHSQNNTPNPFDAVFEHDVHYFRLDKQDSQMEARNAILGKELQGELLFDGMRKAYWYHTSPITNKQRSVHIRSFDPADFSMGWSLPWVYKSDLPPSDELGLSEARDRKGMHWVLTTLQDDAPDPAKYVVYKINDEGKLLATKALPNVHRERYGNIMADFSDGSCLVSTPSGYFWKLDPEAQVVWEDSLGGSDPVRCKEDGFLLLRQNNVWGSGGWLRRFDAKGKFIWEKQVGSDSSPVHVQRLLRRPDGIIVVLGTLFESDLIHDWIGYLNSDAQLMSQQSLPSYNGTSFLSDALISKNDNSVISAVLRYVRIDSAHSESEVLIRKINDAVVQWDYTLRSTAHLNKIGLSEALCGGYVLSAELYSDLYREPHDYLLHSIGEEGEGGDFCFFRKKPFFETSNDDFSPGFVYREWGIQTNGQTQDVYYHKLSFPEAAPSAAWSDGSMNLFPNPSDGELCIEFNADWRGAFDVEILDLKGALVAAFKREKQDEHWISHFSSETLARGIYVLRIRPETGSCMYRRWARL